MDADPCLDHWIGATLAQAQIADGADPLVIAARSPGLLSTCAGQPVAKRRANRSLKWTPDEDAFLRENLGVISEAEIGRILGRSENGVHIRAERHLDLPRPMKDPHYITLNKMAQALGVDAHKVVSWADRGFFPCERLPFKADTRAYIYRRALRLTFLTWAINPKNWVWFDPTAVPDPLLRRLLELRRKRWGDEWWSTAQVAAYHDVENADVVRYIKLGRLQAVRTPNRGGRDEARRWSNWYILRSEATRPGLRFVKEGKGNF